MAFVINSLVTVLATVAFGGPINNGFTVKYNPSTSRDELRLKYISALFARIPKVFGPERGEIITKSFYPNNLQLDSDCSDEITNVALSGTRDSDKEDYNANGLGGMNFLNLPIMKHPFENYKIVVAMAPPHLKLTGNDPKPLIIYIVFSDDGAENTSNSEMNIPTVYFVNNQSDAEIIKKIKSDPFIIVDHNRTVTGLKSKEIEKFVRFKNKLTGRYHYLVSN